MYWAAQSIGICAAIVAFIGYLQKKHNRIVVLRGICDLLFTVQWALLGVWIGAAMSLVCAIKDFVLAIAVKKQKHVKLCTILMCALYVALGTVSLVFGNDQIVVGILLIIISIIGTIAYSIKNETTMRLVDLPTEIGWLIYNSFNLAIGGIMAQSFIIIATIISLIRDNLIHKKKPAEET